MRGYWEIGWRRSIAVVTMHAPIAGLKTGDAIEVFAGCAHDLTTCDTKFNVVHRYGGTPFAPLVNPFVPGGSGVKAT